MGVEAAAGTAGRDSTVFIEYCGTCNYRPAAARLATTIAAATGLPTRLVHSSETGAFEVIFGGERIYSKKKAGRFPDHAAIVAAIERRRRGPA